MKVMGYPLLAIACGPDTSKDELKGWARGVIAIGDIATGLIAFGGLAGGGISVGGISLGAISIGGVSLGGMVLGGVAVGYLAIGGVAVGHYAKGGAAVGTYVSSPKRHDPEAVRLFNSLIPGSSGPDAKTETKPEGVKAEEKKEIEPAKQAESPSADAAKTSSP